ncbi:unnamed protein product, partial [Didymodactylos carnosus]
MKLTTDEVQNIKRATTDETPKLSEQVELEEAEAALATKDYTVAKEILQKLVKIEAVSEDEDAIRIKETAILTLGKLFKQTK